MMFLPDERVRHSSSASENWRPCSASRAIFSAVNGWPIHYTLQKDAKKAQCHAERYQSVRVLLAHSCRKVTSGKEKLNDVCPD
jgi:hypothetical protein